MTNILSWAERELELAGYKKDDTEDGPNKWLREGTLELLKVFSDQEHSGMSAPYAISLFTRLAECKPLTPLTGEESEWGTEVDDNQNNRFPGIFREPDGRAYWIRGIVFWEWGENEKTGEKYKSYFTCRESRVDVKFPFTVPDKPEYRERVE